MTTVRLGFAADWAGFRAAARNLAAAGARPETITWLVGEEANLFADDTPPPPSDASFTVPRRYVDLAETVIMARDPERFALLYGLLYRIRHGESGLLQDAADPAVHRAMMLAHAVRRDIHKMRAFVRFREVSDDGGTRHVAWFEPDHHIVEANAPFFVRRFATLAWSILTPERSVHWDAERLRLGPGASRADLPEDDRFAECWQVYYRAIFNPARLKISAMLSEMPRKYWKNLPEARDIPALIAAAGARTEGMLAAPATTPRLARIRAPAADDAQATPWAILKNQAQVCRNCPLWEHATQTVFGEGEIGAAIMLVGEQPGDQEDLAGRPFIGPAGQVLDHALRAAGLERSALYITNAVKHFKFEPRGRRRIHQKPNDAEIEVCRFWLDQERELIEPRLTVALGATAGRALLGRAVTISRERGRLIDLPGGARALITVHPSYLLRLSDAAAKRREYAAFVRDLRLAAEMAATGMGLQHSEP